MELIVPTMELLFKQLGLQYSQMEINQFIHQNKIQNKNINLTEAYCWTSTQADFLQEAIKEDAGWAPIVDLLNVCLLNDSHH